MSETLIIIDVQDRFVYPSTQTYKECIENTAKEIKLAKRRGDFIVVVEYVDWVNSKNQVFHDKVGSKESPTTSSLTKLLKSYNKTRYVFKNDNDGGREVVKTLRERKIPLSNIRVCGVYANYCVKDTVTTMSNLLKRSKIKLVDRAIQCYSDSKAGKKEAFKNMLALPNVSAI